MSRRRAAVLIGVHVLILIHIGHWWLFKTSLSPLEPSEGMELAARGIVNAGVIFFAVTILATAVLGRWFCGWACHLVALQDLSRWLLKKARIRPRPIRSRVLSAVPLVAFLYMFVRPWLYRLLAGAEQPAVTADLMTSEIWKTFPTWIPAIITLLICGFFCVYFLGAKGFCTNACPYGGVFLAADSIAPLRIRVTEDCTGSGHCTAVCTSNVRVHEEVRQFGKVVDPGCMKCLDCVSVCPNDALYFGLARPRAKARDASPRAAATAPRASGGRRASLAAEGLTLAFCYAAFLLFSNFDRAFHVTWVDWAGAGIVAAICGVMLRLLSRPSSQRAPSAGEELILALSFLAAVFCFRGMAGMVAFLFAMGIAALVAFLTLKAVHLVTRQDVAMHEFVLKRAGRLRAPAAALVLVLMAVGGLAGMGAAERVRRVGLERLIEQATEADHALSGGRLPADPAAAIELYRQIIERDPKRVETYMNLGMLLAARGDTASAREIYERGLVHAPQSAYLHQNLGVAEAQAGRIDVAAGHFKAAVDADANLLAARIAYTQALTALGRSGEAVEQGRAAVELAPDDADARLALAVALVNAGNPQEALSHVEHAAVVSPGRADVQQALNLIREATGG